jgi:RNA polymerase II-associated factor 1
MEKTKSASKGTASKKKAYSRVLDESMQSWMKKTTYITNDYSRKVHDFKSLAKTKQELEQDLELRQQQIMQRRSAPAVSRTFEDCKLPVHKHPTKKGLKPVAEMAFLPNVKRWGNAYTHVVVDKAPGNDVSYLKKAFVANVEKKDATARMTCQVFGEAENDSGSFNAMQNYELDVVPLKEEDAPHVNFCIWIDPDNNEALFTPIASRVQLSNGRPLRKKSFKMNVTRRPMNDDDRAEVDERLAEVDADIDEKINGASRNGKSGGKSSIDDDDSDDDDHLDSKMPSTGETIVAQG